MSGSTEDASETWNCDPPRNSMPKLNPAPRSPPPRMNGTAMAASMRTAAMLSQMRRSPTKGTLRSPV